MNTCVNQKQASAEWKKIWVKWWQQQQKTQFTALRFLLSVISIKIKTSSKDDWAFADI